MEKIRITKEMYDQLRKPLPAKAVQKHPTKTFLSTIKAIYVIERLNEVFGVGMWIVKNEIVREDTKHIVVKSYLTFEEYTGYFEAYGGNDNADLGDAYKGACTDALTKIGSCLGIAMEVFKGEGNNAVKEEAAQPIKQTEIAQHGEEKLPVNTETGEVIKYANNKQKDQIQELLKHPTITREEKTKVLININKLDTDRADLAIQKLKAAIAEREAQGAAV